MLTCESSAGHSIHTISWGYCGSLATAVEIPVLDLSRLLRCKNEAGSKCQMQLVLRSHIKNRLDLSWPMTCLGLGFLRPTMGS